MTITGQSSLSKEDIDQMVRDAEAHADEDRRKREQADIRNNADSLVYQTDKLLKDQGEKFSGEEKSNVESALADLKTALAGEDTDAIKDAHEKLLTVSQAFTQRLYEQASAESGGAPGGAAGGASGASEAASDEDVVDAEIVDDEEDGKS